MSWLNYHHLLYFWTVAREGSIVRACGQLHLTQPTISGQLRTLEKNVGAKLFDRVGRNLALTDTGRMVYRYAEEIFSLGRELQDTLDGRPPGRPLRLVVGVADSLPNLIAYRLIEPALRLPESVQVICEHGKTDNLLAQLALHTMDVVLTDAPVSPATKIRAFSHLLGECGVALFGTQALVTAYRRGFPQSLNGAPFLLPAENTVLRRSLEQWFDAEGIRPAVRGEFADTALIKVFGQKGAGIFAVRTAVEKETRQQHKVRLLGRVTSIRERFFAISLERKLKHPAVVAITESARQKLFA
ncbi:MAG TPA: transcriptional activator NhaR [Gemmataceae bacterium]|nr:transcriptional activator NhaR [Gemmataceae bacterium]